MDEKLLVSLQLNLIDIFFSSDSIAETIQKIERIPITPLQCLKGVIAPAHEKVQKIIYLYAYEPEERLISPPIMGFRMPLISIMPVLTEPEERLISPPIVGFRTPLRMPLISFMPVLTEAIDAGYSKTIAILANVRALEYDTSSCFLPLKAVLKKFLEQGQISYARALLDHGAEVNKSDDLPAAIKGSCNPDMFEMLLQHKADVHESSSLSPLAYAFEYNNFQAVRWLIDKGADAGALVWGETILKRCPPRKTYEPGAVLPQCDLNIIKILIDNGAKMEPYSDIPPLCFLIGRGHSEAARMLLLEYKADPNKASDLGHTPLKAAISSNDFETMKILLELGVKLNYPPTKSEYQLPLHYAVGGNKVECVQWLLESNADPAALDFYGRTPAKTTCLSSDSNESEKAKALAIQKLLADAIAQSQAVAAEENAAAGGEKEPYASANCFIEEESTYLGAQALSEQE